jgi:hypothetical protein
MNAARAPVVRERPALGCYTPSDMRTDILPLCDKHFRTMEACIAPYSPDYSIDFFRCTEKFCGRCFGERVGYVNPKRNDAPELTPDQPRCDMHGRPMFIVSLDRQHNRVTYACTEPGCVQRVLKT